jgi:drug/metabolite transporter (DMT)-like permease
MRLDVRVPIGLLFGLLGTILVVTGLVTASPIDSWAGSAMLAFGAVCFALTYRRRVPSVSPHR